MNASSPSRRDVLETTGKATVASAIAGLALPSVHAGHDSTINVALVGCGGRGTGAAENSLRTTSGPIKLTAMADAFADRLKSSHTNLTKSMKEKVDVPEDRRFLGYDGYKKAMDSLKKGDVVVLATPPAFRWPMFAYAIEKGLNVFMEKPTTVDGPSTRKMFKLAAESEAKGLKVAVGLMCRHCPAREALFEEIQKGAIGDINLLRAYRMHGPVGSAFSLPRKDDMNELEYQIRRFHSFLWASGGTFSDFMIHNIDESCWMKNAWPISASGQGGRHYRGKYVDQNFDSYSVEYTFADGTKFFLQGRCMEGTKNEFASYAHGSKGTAVISAKSHWPALCRIYKGHNQLKENETWRFRKEVAADDPYQVEWNTFIDAIRGNKPYNEAKRGAEASLVTSMGRMACHIGGEVTWDQILNSTHEFAPDVDKFTSASEAPVKADANGMYPIPEPGKKKTEY